MKLKNLLVGITTAGTVGPMEVEVTAVQADSRLCGPGGLFVAVRTVNSDGHRFIDAAIGRGARVIVCETLPADVPADIAFVQVGDSRKALALLALRFHGDPHKHLRFLGVTGTNGKTTCSYLLRAILRRAGARVAVIGTTGNIIHDRLEATKFTTPEQPALAELLARLVSEQIDWVVIEVSSHALALDRVAEIDFDGALFTNLTRDHLDFHGSMRDYIAAKRLLFERLRQGAIAAANGDDPQGAEMAAAAEQADARLYGRTPGVDTTIVDERLQADGSDFRLRWQDGETPAELELHIAMPGKFNVLNAAGAATLCLGLGIDPIIIREGLAAAAAAPGRMQSSLLPNGANAVVDYAHTPDALTNALRACRDGMAAKARLICVFGCGGDRDAGKRPLMGQAAAAEADVLIVTNDNPRTEQPEQIVHDILAGLDAAAGARVRIILDRRTAIHAALAQCRPGDVALIAGKGHEEYQIVGTERLDFSDQREVDGFIRSGGRTKG